MYFITVNRYIFHHLTKTRLDINFRHEHHVHNPDSAAFTTDKQNFYNGHTYKES